MVDFLSPPLTLEADADDDTDIETCSNTMAAAAAGSPTSCFSTLPSSDPLPDAVLVAIVVPEGVMADVDINILIEKRSK